MVNMKRRIFTTDELEILQGRWKDMTVSIDEIAIEFHCSNGQICYIAHKIGLPKRNTLGNHHKSDRYKSKYSKIMKKRWEDPDYRRRTIESITKTQSTDEYRERMSKIQHKIRGNKDFYLTHPISMETRRKTGISVKRVWLDPTYREMMHIKRSGPNNPNWRGGIAYKPYCHKFNEEFKEIVRNSFNRICFCCGKTEIANNGKRLSVHHIDYNKVSICKYSSWAFVPLCNACHSKTNFNRYHWFNLLINYWLLNNAIHLNRSYMENSIL